MVQSLRRPAVSGMFYPSSRNELVKLMLDIESREINNFDKDFSQHHIIGGIVPHAGYIYSGCHAIHFFLMLQKSKQKIDTVIIINPNHRGFGPAVALDSHSIWESPLGQIEVDDEIYKALDIPVSLNAHNDEHSGEVMVPFIQYYLPASIKIAPVSMLDQSYESAKKLAQKIDNAVIKTGKKTVIIASSDFSHFVKEKEGCLLDNLVCEKIENMDAKGVHDTVRKNNISVCGYGPIMSLIEYCKIKHPAAKTHIMSRGNSGEISPSTRVVNYICTLFYE